MWERIKRISNPWLAGTLSHTFSSQHLMIIALKDLDQHNGLSMVEEGDTLACERNIVLSEDKDMSFSALYPNIPHCYLINLWVVENLSIIHDSFPSTSWDRARPRVTFWGISMAALPLWPSAARFDMPGPATTIATSSGDGTRVFCIFIMRHL